MNDFMRILIGITFIVFTGFALAEFSRADESKDFYIKVGGGVNKVSPHNFNNQELNSKTKAARHYPLFKFGIGYQYSDTIRTELVLNHHFMFNTYENSRDMDNDLYKITHKVKIDTLMLNTYKDLMTIGNYTPFIGGGIGISNIKQKSVGNIISTANGKSYGLEPVSTIKTNRFNFKLSAGVDMKLSDNVKAELTYNFFDLGYNKPNKINNIDTIIKRNYKVHNITASIRYSL